MKPQYYLYEPYGDARKVMVAFLPLPLGEKREATAIEMVKTFMKVIDQLQYTKGEKSSK